MAKRAVIYLRSSKDRHDVSVESQRRELERYIKNNGNVLIDEFVDKVESAKTANRPAFQDMMAEVKSKECRFSVIYCFDTSRFSRRMYDAQLYKHLLKKNGIDLVFMKLPKGDPLMDTVLESLMEIFDEFHSQKSKMDGLRGMRENVLKGWRSGGSAPIGYKLEKTVVGTRDGEIITKSTLKPDPKTFHKMKQYFEGRLAGISRSQLVRNLGLKVAKTSLTYIEEGALTYAGHTVWNRHNEVIDGSYKGGKRYRDRDEWVIQRNTHEAMITEDEAEQILKEREVSRASRKRRRISTYLLAGIFKCGCGANMSGDSGYYRCQKRCGNKGIKKETIEEAIISTLFEQLLSQNTIMELLGKIKKNNSQKTTETNKVTALNKEIKEVEKQINEIITLLQKVKHQRPLLSKLDELEEERVELEGLIDQEQSTKPSAAPIVSKSGIIKFLKDYKESFQTGDVEKKKALLQSTIKNVELNGDRVKINPSYVSITGVNWHPQGDSNPCCRRERAVS